MREEGRVTWEIRTGDCLALLRDMPGSSVDCCVTSPPYFSLRDYGHPDQIGLEPTVTEFIDKLAAVFAEVKRVLKPTGTLFVNIGDSYNGSGGAGGDYSAGGLKEGQPRYPGSKVDGLRSKSLIGVPWRLAFALMADGWILRSDIIWHKPAPMPESVTDRPSKAHEYVFLLAKQEQYFYDADAIAEPSINAGNVVTLGNKSLSRGLATGKGIAPSGNGCATSVTVTPTRNKRSVWTINTEPFGGAHFATMPPELAEMCIKAGSSQRGCCGQCGAPWSRQVERSNDNAGEKPQALTTVTQPSGIRHGKGLSTLSTQTLWLDKGWQPGCTCGAEVVPAVVLDPFSGAGTTCLVAHRLGRHGLGLELNQAYVDLANERIINDAPLFNKPTVAAGEQLKLPMEAAGA